MKLIQTFLLLCVLNLACKDESSIEIQSVIVLDQEKELESGKAMNASTQSINRYHSSLRKLCQFSLKYNFSTQKLEVVLSDSVESKKLYLRQIEAAFLLPLLPYPHERIINSFDKANLVLAEFARNGIELSYQKENTKYAFFYDEGTLFDEAGEYLFDGKHIMPNPAVLPLRLSLINNCLNPGLWELSAKDAVGEMYHGWITLDTRSYFDLVKAANGIGNTVEDLSTFFQKEKWTTIPLELDRLREVKKPLFTTQARVAKDELIGGYSTQDSRRKVQRGFFHLSRSGDSLAVETMGALQEHDVFNLHSFIAPGIYDHETSFQVPYDPAWDRVEVKEVSPLSYYKEDYIKYEAEGFIEITVKHRTLDKAFIVGNIPISLLVFSNDYQIPAFGVGALAASELVERRHLRLAGGPPPAYAYLAKTKGHKQEVLNNHLEGYEQVYLRPFKRDNKVWLRFTVVSYERIVDLLEFEFPVEGELARKIEKVSKTYQPPLYEVYADDNLF